MFKILSFFNISTNNESENFKVMIEIHIALKIKLLSMFKVWRITNILNKVIMTLRQACE